MRQFGLRDEEQPGASSNCALVDTAQDEAYPPDREAVGDQESGEWDFSADALFVDETRPRRIEVPGRPGDWIEVRVAPDTVAKGLSRFTKTIAQYQAGRNAISNEASITFDGREMALYKRRECITNFSLTNRSTGQVVTRHPRDVRANDRVYGSWTGKFADWVDEQIQIVNGWDDAGRAAREHFSDEAGG